MRARSLERGQVLPLIAVCLAVLMGFAAMAVDAGYLEYRQRQQQSAADAAAIGGAQQLGYVGCNDPSAAQTAGQADAATNGFPDESTTSGPITVKVHNPPVSGPYTGNNCAVQVTINNTSTQTFFSQIFGYSQIAETTEAVAISSNSAPLCAVQLGSGVTPKFHGNKISAAGCALEMNGTPDFDGGTIDFLSIGYAGGSITENGTKWVEASPAPSLPVADPCPEITGCRELLNNPPSTSGCGTAVVSNGSIGPGCYSSVPKGVSTLQPGLYVFTGGVTLKGVTGTGVTIYVADGGSFSDGGSSSNLTPCTTSCGGTGAYQAVPDVLFFQPASNQAGLEIYGAQSAFGGLVYAPGADLTIDGNGGTGYQLVVFNNWTINGTGQGMTFAPPPPGGGIVAQAVLVQ